MAGRVVCLFVSNVTILQGFENILTLHNVLAALFLFTLREERAAGGHGNDVICIDGNNSFSSPLSLPATPPLPPQPIPTHYTLPPLCCLPTGVRAECSMGVGRETSVALSGLHCLYLIVPRDVDNHNRRKAGEPQWSREKGGVVCGSFCLKALSGLLCVCVIQNLWKSSSWVYPPLASQSVVLFSHRDHQSCSRFLFCPLWHV